MQAASAQALPILAVMEAQKLVREGQTMIAHDDRVAALETLRHALRCLTVPGHYAKDVL